MPQINQDYPKAVEHFGAGRAEQARFLCEQILSQNPDYAPAMDLLGMALFDLGRTEEAIEAFRRAAALGPKRVDTMNNLGVALNHVHRYAEALVAFTRALELQPQHAEICNNIGITLFGLGRFNEAVEYHTRAADLRPDFREAFFHRGRAHAAASAYAEALADYRRAVDLAPDWPDAWNGIGMTCVKQIEFETALAAYDKAIELDRSFFQAYYNRANLLVLLGRYDQAIADFTKALELHSGFDDARWNRGLAFLLKGDYARGWKDYGCRKNAAMNLPTYPHLLNQLLWTGESFAGKRLLVHYEQGYGDSIQCWRFLPQVRELGGTVIVDERKPLLPLLKEMDCADEIIASGREPPQTVYDLHVSMLDLPRLFSAEPGNVGRMVPYLRAPEERIEKWAGRIDRKAFSIGIVWAGSPKHKNDQNRSARLNYFLPLGRIEGVRLYSLQKGPAGRDLSSVSSVCPIGDLGSDFEDFADTAGAMAHLDLVISVDTAVLHLAGAMGRLAWGLLAFAPDWRWMRECQVSPWYPTVRLFRQSSWGDWNEVFLRVIEAVKQTLQSPRS